MSSGRRFQRGRKIDTPIYLQDIVPTTLELAGADLTGIDFHSLLPLLRGEEDPAGRERSPIYGAYLKTQRMIARGGRVETDPLPDPRSGPSSTGPQSTRSRCPTSQATRNTGQKIAELHAELQELGTALADPIESKISCQVRGRGSQGAEKEEAY